MTIARRIAIDEFNEIGFAWPDLCPVGACALGGIAKHRATTSDNDIDGACGAGDRAKSEVLGKRAMVIRSVRSQGGAD